MLELLFYSLGMPLILGAMTWQSYMEANPQSPDPETLPVGGDDILSGTEAADSLHGRGGNDEISGLGGDDLLLGGAGADTVLGGPGADTIWGGEGDDLLLGGTGHDMMGGGAGADRLLGGAGNDSMTGGAGADSLFGGAGDDLVTIWPELAGDEVFLEEGDDWLDGSAALAGVLGRGGAGADRLIGGAGADTLCGDGGDDVILGGAGADVLEGGAGADRLDGGAGNDMITGGTGADSLIGGAGEDRLIAGAGDWLAAGEEADRIDLVVAETPLADWAAAQAVLSDYVPGLDRVVVEIAGWDDLSSLSLRFDAAGADTLVSLVDSDPAALSETALLRIEGVALAQVLRDDFLLVRRAG
ncbi:hemolysin expression modulating protein [Tabrizicola sp. TH137]|uniref:calcium-binding protein n=1 Tax=Tabrizicola sp. TH137 TaxID=2067452 RepID=UPI000C7B9CB2|nr:calcium-binding protein [Tabrizicola sp. TH137]PLL14389.1 hemolysin expression modulating protein [Tabrizicola sp. TH137]